MDIAQTIGDALKATMDRLAEHARRVGLANTDEFTFRSLFLAELKRLAPSAECQTEWHKFDLLLQAGGVNILIEFKYYISRRTRELDGTLGAWKGGASPKNEGEFRQCVAKLRRCSCQPIHHKYLILVYERECERRSRYSFARSYDALCDGDGIAEVHTVSHPSHDQLTCKLLRIT